MHLLCLLKLLLLSVLLAFLSEDHFNFYGKGPLNFLFVDPRHKADGEVVAGSEEQPKQIRELHPEDAYCYSTQ